MASFVKVVVLHVLRRLEELGWLVLMATAWHLHEVLFGLLKKNLEKLLLLAIEARVNPFILLAYRQVKLVSFFLVMPFDELSLLLGCIVIQRVFEVLAPAELLTPVLL